MTDGQSTIATIAILCDADSYTKYEYVQTGRDLFTVYDFEPDEIKKQPKKAAKKNT